MDNAIIKIEKQTIGKNQINAVNARELHVFLESKRDFSNWIKRRIEKYGFVENVDYVVLTETDPFGPFIQASTKLASLSTVGLQQKIEYHISIDMAKELSMVENNEKGSQARKYFIECERQAIEAKQSAAAIIPDFNNPIAAAEAWIEKAKSERALLAQIEEQKPKILAYEKFINSTGYFSLTAAGKILYKNPNKFMEKLRDEGILYKRSANGPNLPHQYYLDAGYFEVKTSGASGRTSPQTMVTIQGIDWLSRKICNHKQIEMFEAKPAVKRRISKPNLRLIN